MHGRVAKDILALKKRLRWYLDSPQVPRHETQQFLSAVGVIGDVAIFGGMVRDIAFSGSRDFRSDVDAVIATEDHASLDKLVRSYDHTKNRFGGYRIQLSRSSVDLWTLDSTWAFRSGVVQGRCFADLIRTTFFDWDAIVFEVRSGRIHTIDGYLERLRRRLVDINLPTNPNPLGAVLRTLRLVVSQRAALSNNLADHLCEHLATFDTPTICRTERGSFKSPILLPKDVDETRVAVSRHVREGSGKPFVLPKPQVAIAWRAEV
jgi:predicted nucleotidyltransferase